MIAFNIFISAPNVQHLTKYHKRIFLKISQILVTIYEHIRPKPTYHEVRIEKMSKNGNLCTFLT